MSQQTNIEWATSTGNPWIGCTKVSPGCKNCYAETMDRQRYSKTLGAATKENPISHWGKGAPRWRTKAFWTDAVKWNSNPLFICNDCGKYRELYRADIFGNLRVMCECDQQFPHYGHRQRIFPSLCDWLDDEVPIEWLGDFLKLIHDTTNLDWLLLTKRPEDFFNRLADVIEFQEKKENRAEPNSEFLEWLLNWQIMDQPPRNIWLGVSVENQKCADERISQLIKIPAAVRFLSVEPLLENVSFRWAKWDNSEPHPRRKKQLPDVPRDGRVLAGCVDELDGLRMLDWVIVGGESGPGRRDCGLEAIVNVAEQCVSAGVPCFIKQDCAAKSGQQGRIPDEIWKMKQFPR